MVLYPPVISRSGFEAILIIHRTNAIIPSGISVDSSFSRVGRYTIQCKILMYLSQVFDLRANTWDMSTSMSSKRGRVGVATLNQHLYALGGYNGTSYLKLVGFSFF